MVASSHLRKYVKLRVSRAGRRWGAVGSWLQMGVAITYLSRELKLFFYGATKKGERLIRNFGDSYRREHYKDSQYWH